MEGRLFCDVVEIGKRFATIVNGKVIDDIYVQKSVENAFISCGDELSQFEREKEDSFGEKLKLLFSEENLKTLYKGLKEKMGYEYTSYLRNKLTELCNQYNFKAQHFIEQFIRMFEDCIYQYDRSLYHEIYEENQFFSLTELMMEGNSIMLSLQTDVADLKKSILENEEGINVEDAQDKSVEDETPFIRKKWEWKITYPKLHSMLNGFKNKQQDIAYLTNLWKKERENAPLWYIFPREKRYQLCIYTGESYLLSRADDLPYEEQLQFAYEIVWRMEKGFIAYSIILLQAVERVWGEIKPDADPQQDDNNRSEWFFIGQSLLREYREDLKTDKWQSTYNILKPYDNGELKLEKAKMLFMQMRITETRDFLQSFDNTGLNYGARLQIAGLKAECGLFEKAKTDLIRLERDLQMEISGCETKDDIELCKLEYSPILYAVYYMLSFIIQAMHPFERNEELKTIWEKEEEYKQYFDFDIEKTKFIQDLYKKGNKERKDVPFPLHKEVRTMTIGTNSFIEAYDFLRLVDRMGFPLHMGYTRLLEDDESDFVQCLMDHFNYLGWFMLLRFGSQKTIEKMLTRKLLLKIDAREVFSYVYDAVIKNIEFVQTGQRQENENAYGHVILNGLEIVKRLASIVGISEQKKILALLCRLVENNIPREYGTLRKWTVQVMHVVDDRAKAAMLNDLLRISVRKEPEDQIEKITDPFDVLYTHELSEGLYQQADIDADSIDFMLDEIEKENKEKRVYFSRLGQLYEWHLLSCEQEERMSQLLWKDVKEDEVPYFGEYYSFVILGWPCPQNIDPVERIKKKLLDERNFINLREKELSFITLGSDPYLRDIIKLNENTPDFWDMQQIENFITEFIMYWKVLKENKEKFQDFDIHKDEFISRTRNLIKVIASFGSEKLQDINTHLQERLKDMMQEIATYEIAELELEVQMADMEQIQPVVKKILKALKSVDAKMVLSGLEATEYLLTRQGNNDETIELWNCLIDLCRYRKEPGLEGTLITLHNLLYRNCKELSEDVILSLNDALNELIQQTDYENYINKTERELRCAVELREGCANLAYQLYLYEKRKQIELSSAVLNWKEICRGKKSLHEFSEVRRCWLDV